MAKAERSFWSSLPGVLTGLAGTLTAAVALLGLALSQGWIGDEEASTDGDADSSVEEVGINVDPGALSLTKAPTQDGTGAVTVTNDGTKPVTVTAEISGGDEASFEADDSDCTRNAIPPGGKCEVEVVLNADVGTYRSVLVVSANGNEQVERVELSGRALDPLGL